LRAALLTAEQILNSYHHRPLIEAGSKWK